MKRIIITNFTDTEKFEVLDVSEKDELLSLLLKLRNGLKWQENR